MTPLQTKTINNPIIGIPINCMNGNPIDITKRKDRSNQT